MAGTPKAPRTPRVPRYPTSALMTPANGVTMLRMAITPLMLMYIARREYDTPTFLLWWVLCGTDGIDGMLARRFGVTSSGAFLDPLADKFLILGALVVLVAKGAFWWPWVGREWPWLAQGTLVLATALTVYSGWLYFSDARRGVVRPAGAGVAPR